MCREKETRDTTDTESVELVRSFLAGDRRAFDRLILLHKRLVFNLCYRMLGDYDDADDCAQEVFIKVNRSVKDFRFESSFTTWLYRISVNTCKNTLTSREYRLRSKKVPMDSPSETNNETRQTGVEDTARSPAGELLRREIDRLIQDAVRTLPDKQRLIVVLRDFEGKSYEDIAEITGAKLGTVKSSLSRARLQLREALKGKI
jgi:RNA polymerase sigma-70 factor (ECF subfamily)